MEPDWTPITQDEFEDRLRAEMAALSSSSRECFHRYQVKPWQAIIRRPDLYGDERVWVVAQTGSLAVFFDDVDDEFGVGSLDGGQCLSDCCLVGELTYALNGFPEGYASRGAG